MSHHEWLTNVFEENRGRLRAVAYRMLGSLDAADDAVQETWIRLHRSDPGSIDNVAGWLTTVVARICLNVLRARNTRGEQSLDARVPDPLVSRADHLDPEQAVLLADSVGLALLVILETLGPEERLAFVLHDMFGLTFDEIAPLVGRSPVSARQLASRARRRVRDAAPSPDGDRAHQREVVEAFLVAARGGDLEALLAILDPDVVIRADRGLPGPIRGARAVAERALMFSQTATAARVALVNGTPGLVSWGPGGYPMAVIGLIARRGKVVAIDILSDPARLARLDLTAFEAS